MPHSGPRPSLAALCHATTARRALARIASLLTFAVLLTPVEAVAQREPIVNANWLLADKYAADKLRPFVYSTSVNPRWINDTDSLWYNWQNGEGTTFYLVVPKSRSKTPLFDHDKLAGLLSAELKRPVEPRALPFNNLLFTKDGHRIRFRVDSAAFEYDLRREMLDTIPLDSVSELGGGRGGRGGGGRGGGGRGGRGGGNFRNFSPDSTAFAFAREHNLFFVDVETQDTIQLTTDGEQYYSFGARNDDDDDDDDDEDDDQEQGGRGGRGSDPRVRANVTWSDDSKAFYVTRNDSRKVGMLYLVNVLADPRPTLMEYKYAMPGEENVTQNELFVFNRDTRKFEKLPIEKWKDQRLFNIHWTPSSDKLRLVRRDRLQRNLELIEVDLPTKEIKTLITESVENAFIERQNVRYVNEGGDMIWFSERTGWGHFYLYANDGTLKNAITSGPWRAESLVELDSVGRIAYVRGVGREAGENPYYSHLYRVNLDGTGLTLLDPGNATHNSSLSPSRKYLVDNASRIDMVPEVRLRDANGKELLHLETTDISKLEEVGWHQPETFVVKAADGVTDIYGNMWKPFDFDPNKKYPIIAHVYPGPQTESVTYGFSPTNNNQTLAQLGFIVIQLGNRGGSPQRSNAYHSFGYYNLRDYGLADKKAGIEQLAARHPWIDIERVGIYGHSGGGFMTAAALLQEPYNDFFKVGVSSAGNHDNNIYNQNWSEQHHGLREVVVTDDDVAAGGGGRGRGGRGGRAGGQGGRGGGGQAQGGGQGQAADGNGNNGEERAETRFEIHVPANSEIAENLKGRLLLVHGDMDNNVHPGNTIRLVDALIRANKRFDMMILPGRAHGFGPMQGYFNRMMYEYFAEHLLGDYYRTSAEIK